LLRQLGHGGLSGEVDLEGLAGEVATPLVDHLDGQLFLFCGNVYAGHGDLITEPAGQRLAYGELDRGGEHRIVRVEDQAEQAAAEVR
jgi:hypothetical protein